MLDTTNPAPKSALGLGGVQERPSQVLERACGGSGSKRRTVRHAYIDLTGLCVNRRSQKPSKEQIIRALTRAARFIMSIAWNARQYNQPAQRCARYRPKSPAANLPMRQSDGKEAREIRQYSAK